MSLTSSHLCLPDYSPDHTPATPPTILAPMPGMRVRASPAPLRATGEAPERDSGDGKRDARDTIVRATVSRPSQRADDEKGYGVSGMGAVTPEYRQDGVAGTSWPFMRMMFPDPIAATGVPSGVHTRLEYGPGREASEHARR